MIIYLYVEIVFDKIKYPFMIKVLEREGIQGTYLNIIKVVYSKSTANIKLSGEKLGMGDLSVYVLLLLVNE